MTGTTTGSEATAADAFRRGAADWQRVRLLCVDRSLRVFLGGQPVTEAQLIDEFTGRLGFSVTRGTLEFRNFRVRRLDQFRDSQPLPVQFPDAVDLNAPGVKVPHSVHAPRPDYTQSAIRDRIEGIVGLEIAIDPDGSVGAVRLTRPLHDELDARAISVVKRWRFTPATRAGAPVRSFADVELTFTLR